METSAGSTETQSQEQKAVEDSRNGGSDGRKGNVGRVEEVAGVVIEAVFPDELPEIYNALEIEMTSAHESDEVHTRV